MKVLSLNSEQNLAYFFTPVVYGPLFAESRPSPALPQIGMCWGPVMCFQLGIVILVSIFLADVVHHLAYGLQKTEIGQKAAESRAQLIAPVSFVLFIILGCAMLWFIYRDLYIP